MEKKKKLLLVVASALVVTGVYAQLVPGYDNMGNDINECINETHNCPPCMICQNAEGTYYCFPGYEPCEGDHEHISGGGQALPKPDPEYLANKFNRAYNYEITNDGFSVEILDYKITINIPGKNRVVGGSTHICDFGGDVVCKRGVLGVFVLQSGDVKTVFNELTH